MWGNYTRRVYISPLRRRTKLDPHRFIWHKRRNPEFLSKTNVARHTPTPFMPHVYDNKSDSANFHTSTPHTCRGTLMPPRVAHLRPLFRLLLASSLVSHDDLAPRDRTTTDRTLITMTVRHCLRHGLASHYHSDMSPNLKARRTTPARYCSNFESQSGGVFNSQSRLHKLAN
jgi:hypothetical protein